MERPAAPPQPPAAAARGAPLAAARARTLRAARRAQAARALRACAAALHDAPADRARAAALRDAAHDLRALLPVAGEEGEREEGGEQEVAVHPLLAQLYFDAEARRLDHALDAGVDVRWRGEPRHGDARWAGGGIGACVEYAPEDDCEAESLREATVKFNAVMYPAGPVRGAGAGGVRERGEAPATISGLGVAPAPVQEMRHAPRAHVKSCASFSDLSSPEDGALRAACVRVCAVSEEPPGTPGTPEDAYGEYGTVACYDLGTPPVDDRPKGFCLPPRRAERDFQKRTYMGNQLDRVRERYAPNAVWCPDHGNHQRTSSNVLRGDEAHVQRAVVRAVNAAKEDGFVGPSLELMGKYHEARARKRIAEDAGAEVRRRPVQGYGYNSYRVPEHRKSGWLEWKTDLCNCGEDGSDDLCEYCLSFDADKPRVVENPNFQRRTNYPFRAMPRKSAPMQHVDLLGEPPPLHRPRPVWPNPAKAMEMPPVASPIASRVDVDSLSPVLRNLALSGHAPRRPFFAARAFDPLQAAVPLVVPANSEEPVYTIRLNGRLQLTARAVSSSITSPATEQDDSHPDHE